MQERQFGYFDDAHREYVITNPQTPWPWINYLGNEDFFSLNSLSAGGSTSSRIRNNFFKPERSKHLYIITELK